MTQGYFFDTYALVEINSGNKNYSKFFSEEITISMLNLAELYHYFLKNYTRQKTIEFMDKFSADIIPLSEEIVFNAIDLKFRLNKKKLSLPDCVGYVMAKKHNLKFLTGDKEFKNMPNVEFVK